MKLCKMLQGMGNVGWELSKILWLAFLGVNEVTITVKVLESPAANLWSWLDIIQYFIGERFPSENNTKSPTDGLEAPSLGGYYMPSTPKRVPNQEDYPEKTQNHTRARHSGSGIAKFNIKRNIPKLNGSVKWMCRSDWLDRNAIVLVLHANLWYPQPWSASFTPD